MVLRRYVRDSVIVKTPEVAVQEAQALELADHLAVPTPRLLALDATGEHTDRPALVMTLLDGRPVWETRCRPTRSGSSARLPIG